jgi:hypothetical protein
VTEANTTGDTPMSTELAIVTDPDQIANLPVERRGQIITKALEESKSWLAVATKGTDPTPIAEFKAWAATVAEMTRQKGLAEDIQLDALEMVRRAERGIGVSIRNGQAAGEIRKPGDDTRVDLDRGVNNALVSPTSFASRDELNGNGAGIYHLTDGVSDEQFEEGLIEAREERNLARANVVRKVKNVAGPQTRVERAVLIRNLAGQGYSSRQMAARVGVADARVREIARAHDIDIPADKVTRNTRQIDPERVVRETVNTLQGIEYGLNLLTAADYDAFTTEQAQAWLGALNDPARAIRVLLKELNRRV